MDSLKKIEDSISGTMGVSACWFIQSRHSLSRLLRVPLLSPTSTLAEFVRFRSGGKRQHHISSTSSKFSTSTVNDNSTRTETTLCILGTPRRKT